MRFAFLPAGEDPDTLIAKSGAMAMGKILEAALPLSEVLWRAETEGHDFSTPERRAGLESALREIVSHIADGKIADYYRRDFEQKVFDSFKAAQAAQLRAPAAGATAYADRNKPAYATAGVSAALKQSLLARASQSGQRQGRRPAGEGGGTGHPAAGPPRPGPVPWGTARRPALRGPLA